MTKERIIRKIEIDRDADAAIDAIMDFQGMTKLAIMSRTFVWLSQQSPEMQDLILRKYTITQQRQIAARILKGLNGNK